LKTFISPQLVAHNINSTIIE